MMPTVVGTSRLFSNVILDAAALRFLTIHLPNDCNHQYQLLFSNILHGNSFNNFVNKSRKCGPVLIIIRDDKNSIFGAFTKQDWDVHSTFFGSETCFLFSLFPRANIYQPTQPCGHFMYLNTDTENTFCGLGVGGQIGSFGLFIDGDSTLCFGSSHPCKNFNSPSLSGSTRFRILELEVWGVSMPKPTKSLDNSFDLLDSSVSVVFIFLLV